MGGAIRRNPIRALDNWSAARVDKVPTVPPGLDLTQWRIYSAEQSVPPGESFESIDEARTYLWWVQATSWWKNTFPDAPKIGLELGGRGDGHDMSSFVLDHDTDSPTISLHPKMLSAIVLLHEVAHCIAPRSYGDLRAIRRGRVARYLHHHHGPYFRAAYCALAERYRIGVDPGELRRAFTHFELETPDLDALVEARAHSAQVEEADAQAQERAHAEWESSEKFAELRERMRPTDEDDEVERPPKDFNSWRLPWGYWIWQNRRQGKPLISQRKLARVVNPLVPCSPRDVSRLEKIHTRPTSDLDLRRCLAFAAVLEMDPVWVTTGLNLSFTAQELSMDQLASIAPDWIAEVRHLDDLLEGRPPVWHIAASR